MPRKKKIVENSKIIKLDIGCASNKRSPEYIGVDISKSCKPDVVWDVRKTPWPWKDNSVDEIYTSHFLEHLDGDERIKFFNEAYRVMKTDAEMHCITPAPFTHRYMQDPTHKFPMVVQEFYDYLFIPLRKAMGLLHYPITCNFTWRGTMQEHPQAGLAGRNDEYKHDRMRHNINTCLDLMVTLTKKELDWEPKQ